MASLIIGAPGAGDLGNTPYAGVLRTAYPRLRGRSKPRLSRITSTYHFQKGRLTRVPKMILFVTSRNPRLGAELKALTGEHVTQENTPRDVIHT